MSGAPTIGGLKRLSLYMAGQLASAVAITGGTISGVTVTASLRDTTVETGSTTANLSATGESILGSSVATTYTNAAPVAGGYKFIRNSSATAANIWYTGSTDISIGSNTTVFRITMTGPSSVILKGESATKWGVFATYPSTLVALSS